MPHQADRRRSLPTKISITCPVPTNSQYGNRISATRWAKILTQLGCQARITSPDDLYHRETDLLVALHARHSAGSIASFRRKYPERPIVLILTGTDLYRDIRSNKSAQRSLELADQLVVLQERGLDEVPRRMHDKSCVIYQSETHRPRTQPALHRNFRVIVIGHLRHEKDPFRVAMAARSLSRESRVSIEHYGAERQAGYGDRARKEMERNSRYQWKGVKPRGFVQRRLRQAHVMVLSSRIEGGAGVMTEALAADVPILSTNIPGSIGMMGKNYSGYFNVGKTDELQKLLTRAEAEPEFLLELARLGRQRAHLIAPEREALAWKSLLQRLMQPSNSPG